MAVANSSSRSMLRELFLQSDWLAVYDGVESFISDGQMETGQITARQ